MSLPVAGVDAASSSPRESADIAVRLEALTKRFPVRAGWRESMLHPLRRSYTTVVSDVTCDVHAGEFFGLLGPNGAGKTTLFKMLATLVFPDGGRALVHGADVAREGARVRGLLTPVITDERSLQWRLTARENLTLFAALHGLPAREARARVDRLLGVVGLEDTGAQMVGRFSSGMKQKLLIARALLAQPRVLLLDEPTRSLDPVSARSFRTFLREEISARQGCTILLATHNAEEAFDLCDRLAVLHRGRLLAVGSASDLRRSVGEDRHALWTQQAHHPAFASLIERQLARELLVSDAIEDGWQRVELEIPGGMDGVSRVVDQLTCAGVRLARVERSQLSLAELIERVVQGRAAEHGHG